MSTDSLPLTIRGGLPQIECMEEVEETLTRLEASGVPADEIYALRDLFEKVMYETRDLGLKTSTHILGALAQRMEVAPLSLSNLLPPEDRRKFADGLQATDSRDSQFTIQ